METSQMEVTETDSIMKIAEHGYSMWRGSLRGPPPPHWLELRQDERNALVAVAAFTWTVVANQPPSPTPTAYPTSYPRNPIAIRVWRQHVPFLEPKEQG